MRHLVLIFVALAGLNANADWQETHDKVMGSSSETQLAPILETPTYQPPAPMPQPYQSDADWNRSMEQMDRETQPRR